MFFLNGNGQTIFISSTSAEILKKPTVAFATDSICVTKKLDVDSDELGEFSQDKIANDVYYLQNGFYRFNDSWKLRGLGKLGSKEIEHIKTIEHDGRLYYSYKVLRTKKLASAIIQNQISDIGKIKEETREVNLNGDDKRFWLKQLTDINDGKMNNSVPLNPEFFAKHFRLNDDYNM